MSLAGQRSIRHSGEGASLWRSHGVRISDDFCGPTVNRLLGAGIEVDGVRWMGGRMGSVICDPQFRTHPNSRDSVWTLELDRVALTSTQAGRTDGFLPQRTRNQVLKPE